MIIFSKKYSIDDVHMSRVESTFNPSEPESNLIDAKWAEMLDEAQQAGKQLWDEPCARIEAISESTDGLNIHISSMPFAKRRPLRFLPELLTNSPSVRPNGAYVQCFVVTSDGWYVFGTKSANFSTNSDHSFIGGVYNITDGDLINPVTLAEHEITEELGIKSDSIDEIAVIGAYENAFYNTGIVCLVSLTISRQQVEDAFAQIDAKDSELSTLIYVQSEDIRRHISEHIQQSIEACDILENV